MPWPVSVPASRETRALSENIFSEKLLLHIFAFVNVTNNEERF